MVEWHRFQEFGALGLGMVSHRSNGYIRNRGGGGGGELGKLEIVMAKLML